MILWLAAAVTATGCSSPKRLGEIRRGEQGVSLSLPSDEEVARENDEVITAVAVDTSRQGEPYIMNAIRDEQTGEMVATDVITASRVTARFRHVAERFGKIFLEFDISVPARMVDSKWQLRFRPEMRMMGDTLQLDPLFITGRRYRDAQLRGYQRYEAFVRSIITDTADFVRIGQLEMFLRRHFPDTYAMKSDTSFISEPDAANYFGVTQRQALEHYSRHLLWTRNERRKGNLDRMFRKYVKDPIVSDGIRLDTVLTAQDGGLVYRYRQQLSSRPGLKRIELSLRGSVYDMGQCICRMPAPEDLVFYVSSLSSLADNTRRYKQKIVQRRVFDRTLALIDFSQGSSSIDTTLEGNASELKRILRCIGDISSREEFEPDSIVISASCSPEGSFRSNALLAQRRSDALACYLSEVEDDGSWKLIARSNPENWNLLERLVRSDATLSESSKAELLGIICSPGDRDAAELRLSRCEDYRYLREKLYPRLRTVQLEFHLHRRGMVQDTIHTTEPDTLYMEGVEALRNLDYKRACEILRPYKDYNAALALVASAYNYTALEILDGLDPALARVQYLRTVVLSRLERREEALESYRLAVEADPAMAHRANLDPEVAELIKNTQFTNL